MHHSRLTTASHRAYDAAKEWGNQSELRGNAIQVRTNCDASPFVCDSDVTDKHYSLLKACGWQCFLPRMWL